MKAQAKKSIHFCESSTLWPKFESQKLQLHLGGAEPLLENQCLLLNFWKTLFCSNFGRTKNLIFAQKTVHFQRFLLLSYMEYIESIGFTPKILIFFAKIMFLPIKSYKT
jgi:hypothetical protein